MANLVQPVAQFLAAFPANLLFPIVVSAIVVFKLNPNIWLSPLMILGTQWYILFNVIAGAAAIPAELRAVGANFRVQRLAVVAAHRAAGGAAVLRDRRDHRLGRFLERQRSSPRSLPGATSNCKPVGLGAYIAEETEAGDFHRIVLGIAVMSFFVVVVNRIFWRPLYLYAERKFRLG